MKIDEHFKTRISMARQAVKLTQGELADKVGVVRRQIAAYEAGDSKPRDKVLVNLAAALGTTVEWLSHGVGNGPDLNNVRKTITIQEIPLYTYDQAYGLKSGHARFVNTMAPLTFIPAPKKASDKAFALSIGGDSMVSNQGISFPDRAIVTFELGMKPQNGDFVLAILDKFQDVTFKQLIIEQSKMYLSPLNPAYKRIALTKDMEILAVAIHSQSDLLLHREMNNRKSSYFDCLELGKEYEKKLGFSYKKENSSIDTRLDKLESMLEQLLNKKAP